MEHIIRTQEAFVVVVVVVVVVVKKVIGFLFVKNRHLKTVINTTVSAAIF